MKDVKTPLIPLIFSILTFILVYNHFYSILPITVLNVEDFSPYTYVLKGDRFDRVIVKVGYHDGLAYYEFWYHWSYDGFEKRDDWEPVVVYAKSSVYAVAFREHYHWRVIYNPIVENETHVVITFSPYYHTPFNVQPPKNYVKVDYEAEFGVPPEDLNHDEIIGSAKLNALFYASLSSLAAFFVLRGLIDLLTT